MERRAGGETGLRTVQCLVGAEAVFAAAAEGTPQDSRRALGLVPPPSQGVILLAGHWDLELGNAALRVVDKSVEEEEAAGLSLEGACSEPALFLLTYSDGFRAALVHAGGEGNVVTGWAYATRVGGQVHATGLHSTGSVKKKDGGPARGPPYPHFSYLSLNIQEVTSQLRAFF